MRSGALPPVRTVPVPDQVPLKSAKGPVAAAVGSSGMKNAETRATRQQTMRAAGEKRPNVRCKGNLLVQICCGRRRLVARLNRRRGGSGSRKSIYHGISLEFVSLAPIKSH